MAEVLTRLGRQQRIRVLLADEYQMARDWLRGHLERATEVAVVGVAEDGEEAQWYTLPPEPRNGEPAGRRSPGLDCGRGTAGAHSGRWGKSGREST